MERDEYNDIAERFGQLADRAIFDRTVGRYSAGEFTKFMDVIWFGMLCDKYRAINLKRLKEEK